MLSFFFFFYLRQRRTASAASSQRRTRDSGAFPRRGSAGRRGVSPEGKNMGQCRSSSIHRSAIRAAEAVKKKKEKTRQQRWQQRQWSGTCSERTSLHLWVNHLFPGAKWGNTVARCCWSFWRVVNRWHGIILNQCFSRMSNREIRTKGCFFRVTKYYSRCL